MLYLSPPSLLPNFKLSIVDLILYQLFQVVHIVLKVLRYNSQVLKDVVIMLSSLQNLLVLKLKSVLKILLFPINTLLPIKLKSAKPKAVVKKKPKTVKLPRELLIFLDQPLVLLSLLL